MGTSFQTMDLAPVKCDCTASHSESPLDGFVFWRVLCLFLRPPRHLIIAARLVDSRSGLQCMRFWIWHWRGRRPALMASGNRRKFADKPVTSPLRMSAYRSPPTATVQVWRMLGAAAGMPKPQQPAPQGLGAVSGRQPKPGEYPHREILVMSNSRR